MDYQKYDNDMDDSDDNYFKFVRWLEEVASSEFRQMKGDPRGQKVALCRYFKRGYRANLTTSELIDFLGVSYPSILDKAGYSDQESEALFKISDTLTDAEIANAEL